VARFHADGKLFAVVAVDSGALLRKFFQRMRYRSSKIETNGFVHPKWCGLSTNRVVEDTR
jgi:hypothetical protein